MAKQKLKAWYLANTTIRNAARIKDGLKILVDSPLHGNLEGHLNEQQFAVLLNEAGIVRVKRFRDMSLDVKDASDVGRKWRAAMMQMGFIRPGPNLSKQPYTVTPNGQRLINAKILPEEQECFLRALAALQLPSQIDRLLDKKIPPFSPLRVVLRVIAGLEKAGLDASISQDEMAFIVQFVTEFEGVNEAVQKIANYRERLKKAIKPKEFIQEYRARVASQVDGQIEATIHTYADANFRYLKLTGLFADGRRLRFSEYKRTIVDQILSTPYTPAPPDRYLEVLWNGAILPTDNANKAIEVIESTASILREKAGVEKIESLTQLALIPDLTRMNEADLSQLRLELEDDMLKLHEDGYAKEQSKQWEDIAKYLHGLMNPSSRLFRSLEAPAYFEWTLWRAFLAINTLVNKPWNARRFKLDQELKPISPAPGGGPDMIFEFEDFVVVVEVTLTSSSRQEAAEGEPVRRHGADFVDKYEPKGKRVYGLFIANIIDTNTAETFRSGSWYRPNNSRMELQIVPITLRQFTDLFEAAFQSKGGLDYRRVEEIIIQCISAKHNADAPQWKSRIGEHISQIVQQMQPDTYTSTRLFL